MAAASFHAPRCFHPGYSWLGRWLRRRTDRLQGEALHVLLLTGAVLVLLLVHYLSWALLYERFDTTPMLEVGYWMSQLTLLVVTLGVGGVGFRPAFRVTCQPDAITLTQGRRTLTVPLDALTAAEVISAQRFHRHERRYAATCVFIGALHNDVLLLRRAEAGPIVIALPPDAQAALHDRLATTLAHRVSPERAAA